MKINTTQKKRLFEYVQTMRWQKQSLHSLSLIWREVYKAVDTQNGIELVIESIENGYTLYENKSYILSVRPIGMEEDVEINGRLAEKVFKLVKANTFDVNDEIDKLEKVYKDRNTKNASEIVSSILDKLN